METGGGAAVLERVLAGDGAAIDELVAAAWPRLGRGRFRYDSADLRQEAIAELLAVAHEQREQPDDFARVALARVKRRLAQVVRAERTRSARIRPLAPGDDERVGYEPATRLSEQVESPALGRALRRLSPRERAVIARVYWREMSAAEIARREGVGPLAVAKLRRQAEAALRQALGRRR